MNRPPPVCPVCTKEIAGGAKCIGVPGVGVVHYCCRDGAPAPDTGTMQASRCRVCGRKLVEGRPGWQGFTTAVVIDAKGAAHSACADAEAVAAKLVADYVWAMIDTREIAPAARAARIELLCDELRNGITTAIIGAGNRGQG